MPERSKESYRPVFQHLAREAERRGRSLHESFFVELENYSQHSGVRDLSDADLSKVIQELGLLAIENTQGKVGAGAVRHAVSQRCDDPFSDCFKAALSIVPKAKK